ncbi:MAG: hypothetical protein H0W61_09620 [Bacteroidetes bacterium]|nr:hypothetical protein [Bacteroidota bacterium]
MKKIILITAVAGLAFASCKKDRVCSCTISKAKTMAGVTVTTSENIDFIYIKETKRISKLSCVHSKSTETTPNSTTVRESNCVLK